MFPDGVIVRSHLLSVPVDLVIAKSRIRFSNHVVVEIYADGVVGYGEGVLYRALPHQVGNAFRQFTQARPLIDLPVEREKWLSWIHTLLPNIPGLAQALDAARWDLIGQQQQLPLVELLGGAQRMSVPVTEQIFIRDWPVAERELDEILGHGTQRLKVKIGAGPERDLETIRRLRAHVGPHVDIRIDANHAYSLEQSRVLYRELADLGVTALEEPLVVRDWAGLRALRREIGLPIILDESIMTHEHLAEAIQKEAIDVLNLKLSRVGGLTQALDYARICRQYGIGVCMGCSEDLGLGTAAIVHLAAALPHLVSTEGLGPQRLGFDIVLPEWQIVDGALTVPQQPGLGVTLRPRWQQDLPLHIRCFDLAQPDGRLLVYSHYVRWFQRANNVLWRTRSKVGI